MSSLINSTGNSYDHSPYRKNNDPLSMKADNTSPHEFTADKATVLPKRHIQMTQQTQQTITRRSPSRSSPAVARKISATAQSVLGGVKSLLMPTSMSSFSSSNNNNVGDTTNTGTYYFNINYNSY